jgi:hypothetical protein
MAGTLLRLGWTDPRTGVFGAHPQLGGPLDLNDGVTYTLLDETLEIAPPPRELALSGNVRTAGERGLRGLYRHNRHVSARLTIGPMANVSDLAAAIRALGAWVSAPPALPVTLLWQPPGAASPIYLDAVGMASDIPTAERDWLRLQSEPVTLLLITRPGLRGDRVRLQNLVMNPGFEAPSGPGVVVFNDSFASASAYTTLTVPAPTLAANQLTLQTGAVVGFGSPAWAAIQIWQVRVQYATGETLHLMLHYTDANNHLLCRFQSGSGGFQMAQRVAGAYTALAQADVTLTNGAWYWLRITQFPGVAGNPPLVAATLYGDSAGAVGAQIASVGPCATYDAVTALAGSAALRCVAGPAVIGGAYTGVNQVSLFGPGSWSSSDYLPTSAYSPNNYAWEQNAANTYPGGPVTSCGAARVDLAPAGLVNAAWYASPGLDPASVKLWGQPVATPGAGDALACALWVKASGVSASCALTLLVNEYDSGGSFLRQSGPASHSGATAGWIQLSASVTTGVNTAYAVVGLGVADTSAAGASANGTVWVDNVQVWDVTATGVAAGAMPYCELRFPQAPAQLLVSGLLGDLPAPCMAALGTYLTSWPLRSGLTWALARRATASAAARLVGTSVGLQSSNTGLLAPSISSTLDSASYGGYYLTTTLSNGFNPGAFSFAPAGALGVYHLFGRFWSAQTAANLPNVQVRDVTQQRTLAWFGASDLSDQTGQYNGPWTAPIAASSTWTLADAGQANVPALPAGALTGLTRGYLTPRAQWRDLSATSAASRANWQALLLVDGSLLLGAANNPANGPFGVTSSWLWLYLDGLPVNRGGPSDDPAATLSIETATLSNPARGAGGPGAQSSGSIGVNSGADPYLTLDPTVVCPPGTGGLGAGGAGVNQFTALMADGAGAVLPVACDLIYTPLYLYPC